MITQRDGGGEHEQEVTATTIGSSDNADRDSRSHGGRDDAMAAAPATTTMDARNAGAPNGHDAAGTMASMALVPTSSSNSRRRRRRSRPRDGESMGLVAVAGKTTTSPAAGGSASGTSSDSTDGGGHSTGSSSSSSSSSSSMADDDEDNMVADRTLSLASPYTNQATATATAAATGTAAAAVAAVAAASSQTSPGVTGVRQLDPEFAAASAGAGATTNDPIDNAGSGRTVGTATGGGGTAFPPPLLSWLTLWQPPEGAHRSRSHSHRQQRRGRHGSTSAEPPKALLPIVASPTTASNVGTSATTSTARRTVAAGGGGGAGGIGRGIAGAGAGVTRTSTCWSSRGPAAAGRKLLTPRSFGDLCCRLIIDYMADVYLVALRAICREERRAMPRTPAVRLEAVQFQLQSPPGIGIARPPGSRWAAAGDDGGDHMQTLELVAALSQRTPSTSGTSGASSNREAGHDAASAGAAAGAGAGAGAGASSPSPSARGRSRSSCWSDHDGSARYIGAVPVPYHRGRCCLPPVTIGGRKDYLVQPQQPQPQQQPTPPTDTAPTTSQPPAAAAAAAAATTTASAGASSDAAGASADVGGVHHASSPAASAPAPVPGPGPAGLGSAVSVEYWAMRFADEERVVRTVNDWIRTNWPLLSR